MSDCVIRFGGGNFGNTAFLNELAGFLKNKAGRKFVVVSAIPVIKNLVDESICKVFEPGPGNRDAGSEFISVFESLTGKEAPGLYVELAGKFGKLLRGISLIGNYSSALKGQLSCFSEKLSAVIFQQTLEGFLAESRLLFPEDFGLKVTPDYGNATFLSFDSEKTGILGEGIYIIPGSYGITGEGKIARAGESASDYTAAVLAAWLNSPELLLWGLEKDFFSADPEIVAGPPRINRLTYAEASELAYFDHYSFHPRTVEPLEARHIPVKVVSSDSFRVETVINTETFISEQVVKGVAYSDDISILKLNGPGVGLKPGILAKATLCLSNAGINIKSVITSQISINFILGRQAGSKALQAIKEVGFTSVNDISIVEGVSLIGIVGHGMQQHYGISARLFTAVAQNKINVLLSGSGASDLVSYLIVNQSDRDKSVREIHKAFFNSSRTSELINDQSVIIHQ